MTAVDRLIERIDRLVTERPVAVLAVFLLVTVVFAGGLTGIETSAGADQFTQDIPAQQALD
ncbi:hypothetical protein, partial [Halorubrum sp. AJ67]